MIHYFLVVLRLLLRFQIFNDVFHLMVGNKRPLNPHGFRIADRIKEHIALAQQLFRSVHINDGSGIGTGGHIKGNPARYIGFNQAGDNINRRPLGRNNQMQPGRSGHLRQPANRILNFIGSYHHQIRQLINNNHNLRELGCIAFFLYRLIVAL